MTAPAPRRLLWLLAPVAAFAATLALLTAVQGGGGAAAPALFDRPGPASVDVPPDASTAETIAATRAAIEDEPGDAALHATLGDLYYQRGRETADATWNEKAHDAYRPRARARPARAHRPRPASERSRSPSTTSPAASATAQQALRARARVRPALLRDRRRPGRARPLRGRQALARPDGLAQAEPRLVRAHLLLPRAPRRPRRRAPGDAARRVRRRRLRRERRLRRDAARQPRVPARRTSRARASPTARRSRACPTTCPRRPASRPSRPRTGDLDAAITRYEAVVAHVGGARVPPAAARGEARRRPLPTRASEIAAIRENQALERSRGVNTDAELAIFEADHGSAARAVELGRSAVRKAPSVSSADAYSWALTHAGRGEQALHWAKQALRTGWRDPLARYHAGMAAKLAGERALARRWLTQALALNPQFSPLHAPRAQRALALARLEQCDGVAAADARGEQPEQAAQEQLGQPVLDPDPEVGAGRTAHAHRDPQPPDRRDVRLHRPSDSSANTSHARPSRSRPCTRAPPGRPR